MSETEPRAPAAIRAIDGLSRGLAAVAALALVILAGNVAVDVVGRWLFHHPVRGTLEMTANWWMPTLVLLAFAFTERSQEHIKVTILLDALPPRMRQVVEGAFSLLAAGLLALLAYHTLMDALDSAAYGETTASSPPVAIWPFKFVSVLGVAALTLQMLASAVRFFAGQLPLRHDADSDADLV
ncbi:TRAP transporter small permease subunit [Rhodobacterales bacterium HKCCE2091]|nr:TRAP transporter small permease subunit [Rhodobacterales bacterium HKCCE2091]